MGSKRWPGAWVYSEKTRKLLGGCYLLSGLDLSPWVK